MIFKTGVIASLGALLFANAETYPEPPPTLNPLEYTSWQRNSGSSRMAYIDVPFVGNDGSDDNVHLYRLDLVGNTYQRGFDHGALMAKEIVYFADIALSKYIIDAILGIDISGYPEPLQSILHLIQVKGAAASPELVNEALAWVYDTQLQYTPSHLIEEMEAIGDGVCSTLGNGCDASAMANMVKRVNMFPELIQMACTAFGAWGDASSSRSLIQLRALDFGGGPFGNYTVLQVHRDGKGEERAFASLSYPGMVGVITGVAQDGVGLSEKVWYISGEDDPEGSYDGEADVFMLRDVLQTTATKEEALEYMQNAKRTWGIWAGVGDFASQELSLIGYQMASAEPYTDVTMPDVTGQPYMKDLVYVDKHAQPSTDASFPNVLHDMYGNISLATVPIVTQYHGTGDAQIASYDFRGTGSMIFSIGRINSKGEYGPEGGDTKSWCAYNRPYLAYDLNDLWNGR